MRLSEQALREEWDWEYSEDEVSDTPLGGEMRVTWSPKKDSERN